MNDVLKAQDDINEYIRKLSIVHREIDKIKEGRLKELNKLKDMLDGIIIQYLQSHKLKSTKADTGWSVSWYIKMTFSVQDQSEFRSHVIGTESWDLIEWRCNATAGKEYTQAHGDIPPPGVKPNQKAILRLTPPTRPKLETATVEVQEDSTPVESI